MESIGKTRIKLTDSVGSPFGNDDLPPDILITILLKQPVKSLLRFRSVSKYWQNTIDGVFFTDLYQSTLAAADDSSESDEPQILPVYCLTSLSKTLHPLIYDGNVIRESEYPALDFSRKGDYYGICHVAYGLLCFQKLGDLQDEAILCNPLRGEVLELPVRPHDSSLLTVTYGIGFDSTKNEYKILRIKVVSFGELEPEVYTLGTSSWRALAASPSLDLFYPHTLSGVSAYGDIHWLCVHNKKVISFGFKKEEFNIKQAPVQDPVRFGLVNLKGSLAIVSFQSTLHMEIWVLKDYEKNNWAREHIISTYRVWARQPDNTLVSRTYYSLFTDYKIPIGACSRGVFFESICTRKRLFFLDLQTNCIYYLKCPLPEPEFGIEDTGRTVLSYTSNFISLRNFSNSAAKIRTIKCNFLKTTGWVYVCQ